MAGEFDLIARLLRPLSKGHPGAYDLSDDAALVRDPAGHGLVVTTDTLVEGTHFLSTDPIDTVARKLVRVNLSDLIAKAATPTAAFLTLAWPQGRPLGDLERFAGALGEDLDQLCGGVPLMGGDTTSCDGPLVATLVLMGTPVTGRPILRRGAGPLDVVAVTGTIGDSVLGLAELTRRDGRPGDPELIDRYRVPAPPCLAFTGVLGSFARASVDISDGLVADLGHMAAQSGVQVVLDLDALPISAAAHRWLQGQPDPARAALHLATGGDDYQTAFVLRATDWPAAQAQAASLGVTLTRIGACRAGEGVAVRWASEPLPFAIERGGWQHDLG